MAEKMIKDSRIIRTVRALSIHPLECALLPDEGTEAQRERLMCSNSYN